MQLSCCSRATTTPQSRATLLCVKPIELKDVSKALQAYRQAQAYREVCNGM